MKTDEAMILCQLILDPAIYHELTIDSECFLRPDTRQVFQAISKIIDKGGKPDLISIRDIDGTIDAGKLAAITDLTHSSANWQYHEGKIRTAYKRKRIHDLGGMLVEKAPTDDIDKITATIESELMKLVLDYSAEKIKRLDEYGAEFAKELQRRNDNPGALRGVSSGFRELDDMTHGFQPRRLYYIGARPSQGKSAMMMNMAVSASIHGNIPCGIISIESSGHEIIERIFSHERQIPSDNIATGRWEKNIFSDLKTLATSISGQPLYIYDKPNMRIDQIRSVARVMRKVFQVQVIFIDYLQLIRNQNQRLEKTGVVMESSQALKELARELEVPIVCLAQLGRDADDRKPTMGDFQWSSQAEQDADFCGLIWHEQTDDGVKTWHLVAKNRDGRKGAIPMRFDGATMTFTEC